jgi:hypothetical protein
MKGESTVPEKRRMCVCVGVGVCLCVFCSAFYRNYSMDIYAIPLKYDAT